MNKSFKLSAATLATSALLALSCVSLSANAAGDINAGKAAAEKYNCAACHGTNGRAAPGSAVAGMAGRPKDSLLEMLVQFRDGRKPATLMHQITKGYSEAELAAMADFFSKQSR